jgi:hypothetical protein
MVMKLIFAEARRRSDRSQHEHALINYIRFFVPFPALIDALT